MSVNYSFSTNDSLPSELSGLSVCSDSIISYLIFTVLSFTNVLLLLPLSVSVLILGFQRWRQQRSSAAATSFSDFFTYNMAIMELIGVFGCTFSICTHLANCHSIAWLGYLIAGFPWSGQMYFPILTCVDRYLAVVHPITYLRLRQVGSVSIRNISTGAIWLQCFAGVGFILLFQGGSDHNLIPSCTMMAVFLIFVTFSSISVLCVLTRPRPGETAGNRVRVDQSKQRAFHTIVIIMVVLFFRFGGGLVCSILIFSPTASGVKCILRATTGLFNVPSSLVLPLLFLHRAGKIPVCKH